MRAHREVPLEIPGWYRAGSAPDAYEMGIDHDVVHGGVGAAYLKSASATPEGFGTLMQTIQPGAFRGKRIRLSAAVRAGEVTGWAGLWMRVDGKDGRVLAFDNMEDRAVRGSADWARHEVVLDVPDDAADIAFGLLLHGAGTVWLDDVSLSPVDGAVSVTQRANAQAWVAAGSARADYDMGEDAVSQKSGAASTAFLRSHEGASDSRFGTWMRNVPAAPWRGKRVRLSGWVEATAVSSWAGLWMRIDGPAREVLGFDNMQDRPIRGDSPWTRYEVVLDVPDDAEAIAYGTLLQGAGSLRMADVAIEEVESSVPVTKPPRPRRTSHAPPASAGYFVAGSAPDAFEATGDPESREGAVVRAKTADPGGFGTMMKTIDAAPLRGKKARLAARLKADDVRGWAGIWLRVDGADGKPVAFDNMQNRALRGTVGWARHEVILDVPATAQKIAFGALLSGPGRIEVAELALSAADRAAESTDLVHRRRPIADAPRNLGFEE
jgi:hypothetical protein